MKKAPKKRSLPAKTSTRRKSSARSSLRRSKRKRSTRPGRVAYLGLGSNLGDRRANLDAALAALGGLTPLRRVSSIYLTEPVGYAEQPSFCNAVARIIWKGTPAKLLSAVRSIEKRLGRVPTFRNGPRVIDIDLLDVGGAIRRGRAPVLPHARLSERRFVLAPLAEIAPGWRHPLTGLTAKELLGRLPRTPRVRKLVSRKSKIVNRQSKPPASRFPIHD